MKLAQKKIVKLQQVNLFCGGFYRFATTVRQLVIEYRNQWQVVLDKNSYPL